MQRRTHTRNTILQNEATYQFGPVRTMTSAAHSSRYFYVRPESRLIGMVLNNLGYYYSSNGSLTIVLSNGTSTYHVSIVPINPFYYWVPNGIVTNIAAPFLPNVNVPSFSIPLSSALWNWPHLVINYTSRFADVNHGPNHMPFTQHPGNFHTVFLALQNQAGNANTGLSREIIFARMNRIIYQSTERSISDDDTCSICLDDFSDGQVIGSADCHHTFHFNCISQWLMQENSCPLCRRTALTF